MLYWECKKRLETLNWFRNLIESYLLETNSDSREKLRIEINRLVGYVKTCCAFVGESMVAIYTAPPAQGGFQMPVDLLRDFFNLRTYHMPQTLTTDALDRAIGNYERKKKWLFWQMFNPLFWIKWVIQKVISIPFEILGFAGFDARKIESSTGGKAAKAIMGLFVFIALFLGILVSLVTLLDKLGYLETTKKFIGI